MIEVNQLVGFIILSVLIFIVGLVFGWSFRSSVSDKFTKEIEWIHHDIKVFHSDAGDIKDKLKRMDKQ